MSTTEADPKVQTAVRLPASMLKRIEAHQSRMQRRLPGLKIDRSDAFRSLLTEALAVHEANVAAEERALLAKAQYEAEERAREAEERARVALGTGRKKAPARKR